MIFACVLLPFQFIIWSRWPRRFDSILVQWAIVVLLGWFVLVIAYQLKGYLWQREYQISGVMPDGDPAFSMGLTLVFGWVFPLVTSLPFMMIRVCLNFFQQRKTARLKKDIQTEP